jgi:hypothetical protein
MTGRRTRFILALLAIALVPITARLLRGVPPKRCAADGVVIEGAPAVRIERGEEDDLAFCCVRCAESAITATRDDRRIRVLDKTTGETIDAAAAWFVRSRVVAQPATGDRVHVFATREAAERHAEVWRGRLLLDAERPFAKK